MSTGGLSFQQAVQEALAEDATEIVDSDEGVSAPSSDNSDVLDIEQPTVESNEEEGLFTDFFVEQTKPDEEQLLDADSLRFEVNGEMLTIAEIRQRFADLEAGNMMKADYTRKTQELSRLREELNDAKVLWDALHGPNGARVATQLYNRITSGQAPVEVQKSEPDIEALIEQKVQERLAELTPSPSDEERMQAGLRRIEAIFADIEELNDVTLSDDDKQLVLEEAARLGTEDLPFVFDGLMARRAKRLADKNNLRKNATVTPSGVEAEDEDEQSEFGSFREAAQDTLRREGMLDTVFNF